jgi:hypothetical protein
VPRLPVRWQEPSESGKLKSAAEGGAVESASVPVDGALVPPRRRTVKAAQQESVFHMKRLPKIAYAAGISWSFPQQSHRLRLIPICTSWIRRPPAISSPQPTFQGTTISDVLGSAPLTRVDCVVCWHDPSLLEVVSHSLFLVGGTYSSPS